MQCVRFCPFAHANVCLYAIPMVVCSLYVLSESVVGQRHGFCVFLSRVFPWKRVRFTPIVKIIGLRVPVPRDLRRSIFGWHSVVRVPTGTPRHGDILNILAKNG